jgi:hypothetical protein
MSQINLARIAMMKNFTAPVVFCTLIALFYMLYSPPIFAKERCKPFLEKLHNVQSMQRQGYSLKRGKSLRAKEDKARDKWWQCEHASSEKSKSLYGGKKSKVKKAKKVKKVKTVKNKTRNTKKNNTPPNSQKKLITFNQSSAIVIRSKYKGDKKLAWLAFYDKPAKCQSPKIMSVFVYCSENKLQQQSEFEKIYRD